jgi:8-oxo-dGTP pyrophosphatase MutT (NUDIX family)
MTPGDEGRTITTVSRREVYRNKWMRVYEDEILRSNGERGIYGVCEKDASALIIPIQDGKIWLVEQYRYAIGERALELPQGGWEMAVERPEELARGELREELGLEAAEMTFLGQQWIAYGFTKQPQFIFLATGLTEAAKDPDPEEHDLVARPVAIEEFEQMIVDGTIRDQCTAAAWCLYKLWRERQMNQSAD